MNLNDLTDEIKAMHQSIKGYTGLFNTDEWFEWLDTVDSFIYEGKQVKFRVWRTKANLWRVDKTVNGINRGEYIGVTANLTYEILLEIERRLTLSDDEYYKIAPIEFNVNTVIPIIQPNEDNHTYALRALKEVIKAAEMRRKGYKVNYFKFGIQDLRKIGEFIK